MLIDVCLLILFFVHHFSGYLIELSYPFKELLMAFDIQVTQSSANSEQGLVLLCFWDSLIFSCPTASRASNTMLNSSLLRPYG